MRCVPVRTLANDRVELSVARVVHSYSYYLNRVSRFGASLSYRGFIPKAGGIKGYRGFLPKTGGKKGCHIIIVPREQ
jgi:hypothetical protein